MRRLIERWRVACAQAEERFAASLACGVLVFLAFLAAGWAP
jgi:hypothetical protein